MMFCFSHFLVWFCLTDLQEIQSFQLLWIYAFLKYLSAYLRLKEIHQAFIFTVSWFLKMESFTGDFTFYPHLTSSPQKFVISVFF